jgi:hypothetical protein
MVRIAVIVLGVLLSSVANAQSVRLKNYLHPENDSIRAFNDVYLAGAMDALTAYNMAAPVKLFCKEGELVSHEEAAQLILDWANKQTKMQDDTLIVIPLLLLLKKTYPCR